GTQAAQLSGPGGQLVGDVREVEVPVDADEPQPDPVAVVELVGVETAVRRAVLLGRPQGVVQGEEPADPGVEVEPVQDHPRSYGPDRGHRDAPAAGLIPLRRLTTVRV